MNPVRRINKVFNASEEIHIDDSSKIVLMSDNHRGDGGWGDNFSKNQNLYAAALNYYYKGGFTYIEIGDGDELWENRKFADIVEAYRDIFLMLAKFYKEKRLYFIYGNHDMVKKYKKFVRNNLYGFYDKRTNKYVTLFPNIEIHEGLILLYKNRKNKIFLTHGHQVELLNSELWRVSRFLIRYLWRPLELYGVNNPTRTAKNHKKKDRAARLLTEWVIKEGHILIAGHNHMPSFAEVGEVPYFNTGSCVHPLSITGIEIIKGQIMLIRWYTNTREDGTLYVEREVLAGPRRLEAYFNNRDKVRSKYEAGLL